MQQNKPVSIALIAILFLAVYSMSAASINANGDCATNTSEIDTSRRAAVSVDLKPMLDGEAYEGELIVFVHDLSTTPSTRVLIKNLHMPGTVEFEIGLIAIESENQDRSGGSSTIYRPSSIYIHISDAKGSVAGGIVATFNAVGLDDAIDVVINLARAMNVDSDESIKYPGREAKDGCIDSVPDGIDFDQDYLIAGEVHSISGLTVRWHTVGIGSDQTILFFESYERTITYNLYCIPPCEYDTDWVSCGKLPTESLIGDSVTATGNNCYDVMAYANYSCEQWHWGPDIGNPYIEQYYYLMKPESFTDLSLGDSIVCNSDHPCNSNHPGYANTWETGGDNPFIMGFDIDINDIYEWRFSTVDFMFTFDGTDIGFGIGFSLALYRAAGDLDGEPPYLSVTVNSGSPLYYWYNANDATQYLAHFSWS